MDNELIKNDNAINNIFDNIKELVINSRNRVLLIPKCLICIGILGKLLWKFSKETKEPVMAMLF